ncbi:hypothetical protein VD0002_g6857 [Verticillium dahliae]|uniref:Uncharacterized protein n=1 Tax=Verticillium dahliae TaxID=27337 RepID=A0AA45AR38_VERDA|nr:Sorting nexin-4 [Verticillium dahliae VDG2]PNH35801.1 hypothetical protein BJF96_g902 [Verticillium dahliae]PNH53417.1 hypothetical protein VD0003_g3975 [Verticillium dahliae]PNH60839.1 hypothetical protein VD0002_g6857 [Verticillium dahliae]
MAPHLQARQKRADAVTGMHAVEPLAGIVFSVIICLASITVISAFLTQRFIAIKVWKRLPFVVWLVFLIYIDSYLFVFVTGLLQFALGVNTSFSICDGAILLCLVCYVTTKVVSWIVSWNGDMALTQQQLIYLFLVERAHVVRGTKKSRFKSKMYLFNSFGMLGVYVVIAILNFIFRITRLENGLCVIGMQKVSMIPLISFDAVVNIYLTILFLIPLKNLYSFKNFARTPANVRLRTLAMRTFVGALCTTVSSIINLTVLMALNGEPGWVCLMCCNLDILFSAIVVQWVTSKDNAASLSSTSDLYGNNGPSSTPDGSSDPVHRTSPGLELESNLHRHSSLNKGSFGADYKSHQHLDLSTRRPSSQDIVLGDPGAMAIDSPYGPGDAASSVEEEYKGRSSSGYPSQMTRTTSGQQQQQQQHHGQNGVVLVTTTISRESRPGPAVFPPVKAQESEPTRGPGWGARKNSASAGVFEQGMMYGKTEICGGKP